MILVLGCIGLVVIGSILLAIGMNRGGYDDSMEGFGGGSIGVGMTGLIITLLIILLVPSFYQRDKINYEVELTYLASIKDNDQMTGAERISALTEVQTINRDIMTTRVWRDNPWVNWFYAREYGDFPLLSFDAVPKATLDVQVNQDK